MFADRTQCLQTKLSVWTPKVNVSRPNSVFADRTQRLDSERECSQTELGVWTPNVRVSRPNVSVRRPN